MTYHLVTRAIPPNTPNGICRLGGQKALVSPDLHPIAISKALKLRAKCHKTIWLRPIRPDGLLQFFCGCARGLDGAPQHERVANTGNVLPSHTRVRSGETGGFLHPSPSAAFATVLSHVRAYAYFKEGD